MTNLEKIEKNKHYQLEITDMGSEGEGIGKIDGFPIFVENAVKGDIAEVRIVKVKKSYAYGKVMSLIKASDKRAEKLCEHYPRCGGCNLQHLSYLAQLEFKRDKVKNCMERIGGFKDIKVNDTLGMESFVNYRNKAQFPVGMIDGKAVIGFYAKRSHNIINSDYCYIQNKVNEKIVACFREFIEKYNIKPYDEISHKGILRHIITRVGEKTGEIMVVAVINGDRLEHSEEIVKMLRACDENIVSISLNINKEKTNVILGKKIKVIWGKEVITDYIGKLKFEISPLSFYQVNPKQTEVLYGKALEFARLEDGTQTVIDAYCGIGTISLFLAQKAKKVYGVEIVPEAINDAKKNAEINGIKNAEFLVGKSEEVIPQLYEEKGVKAEVIVVDPPRKGCDEKLLEVIAQMKPKRVVYVSCDPATLARDLRFLAEKGFAVEEVQPVDMFCMSSHVETVVRLGRR